MSDTDQLIDAIQSNDAATANVLIDANPSLVSAKNQVDVSMILLATYYGRNEIAQSLLAHGAPLDLFEASAVGALDRIQELVTAQPYRIESFAVDGFTALGLAAFFDHADIVEFHLIRGADPNIASKNPQRVAPLNSAVAGQHLEIAKKSHRTQGKRKRQTSRRFCPIA